MVATFFNVLHVRWNFQSTEHELSFAVVIQPISVDVSTFYIFFFFLQEAVILRK